MEYWINEGADMIWTEDENTSEKMISKAFFEGAVDTTNVSSAELITVVPGGDKTPGFEAMLLIAAFLAVVSLVRYAEKIRK